MKFCFEIDWNYKIKDQWIWTVLNSVHYRNSVLHDFCSSNVLVKSAERVLKIMRNTEILFCVEDSRKTKLLKLLSFLYTTNGFTQIVSKKAKMKILFWSKNPKNNNIILSKGLSG